MQRLQLGVGLATLALCAAGGCGPGTGPNFVRLVNDTDHLVAVQEINQSNSPGCEPLGLILNRGQLHLSPGGQCILDAGSLAPGATVEFSLGLRDQPLPPEIVVGGGREFRCALLPPPINRPLGPTILVSQMVGSGCE